MFVGSMVESSRRGASRHADSSHWANKKGDDQKVHCEGIFLSDLKGVLLSYSRIFFSSVDHLFFLRSD